MKKKFSTQQGEIAYLVQGNGPPYFLLIHNSGGNHEMMSSLFSLKGKIIAPDLLGHGESSKPKIEYTIPILADQLIQLCRHEQIEPVILIGLNYGAAISIEMARKEPKLFSQLILLEPACLLEPWVVDLIQQQIQDLQNPKESWAQEVVDAVILQSSEREKKIGLKALQSTPSFVKASTFRHLLSWDKTHLPCSLPTLLIQASQPFCTEEKARVFFSNLSVGRVVGSGPWITLEVPLQVSSMIDRFLELN